jgi:hypothetical protein
MEHIAIYVNDATDAQRMLEPLLAQSASVPRTVVLCPPRLSHRVGKWLSNRQRQQWQRGWADRLQQQLRSALPADLVQGVEWALAGGRPGDTTAQLRRQFGPALRVFDARRCHLGQVLPALEPGAQPPKDDRWKAPVAISSGLSLVLALVD